MDVGGEDTAMKIKPRAKAQLASAAVAGVGLTLLLWLGQHWAPLRWLASLLLTVLAFAVGLARWYPPFRDWLWEAVEIAFKRWYWAEEEGRHHAHRGVQLDIHDDGRHVWIEADSVRRALGLAPGRGDSEQVLMARHSGRWKRGDDGTIHLRVDTVVEQLAAAPGRMEPKVLHFRRYLEREVLFPAAERRRRAGQG
jgi:hypothetical protein